MFEKFDEDYLKKLLMHLNVDNLILIESSDTFGEFRLHE